MNKYYNVVLVCGIFSEDHEVDLHTLHYYNFRLMSIAVIGSNTYSIQKKFKGLEKPRKPALFRHLKVGNDEAKLCNIVRLAEFSMGNNYSLEAVGSYKDASENLYCFNDNNERLYQVNQFYRQNQRVRLVNTDGPLRLREQKMDVALVFCFFRNNNTVFHAQPIDDLNSHVSTVAQSWKLKWLNNIQCDSDILMHRFDSPLVESTRSGTVFSFEYSISDKPVQPGCDLRNVFSEEDECRDDSHMDLGYEVQYDDLLSESSLMGANAPVGSSFGGLEAGSNPCGFYETQSSTGGSNARLFGSFGTPSASGLFGNFAQPQTPTNSTPPVGNSFGGFEAAYNPFWLYETQSASGGSEEFDESSMDDFIDAFIADPITDPRQLHEHYSDLIKNRCHDELVMVRVDDLKTLLSFLNI